MPTSVKSCLLQIFSHQMRVSVKPVFHIQTKRLFNENGLETDINKNNDLDPKRQKYSLELGARYPFKIKIYPSVDPKFSLLCSQVRLRRPLVPQGAKVGATGLPNPTFWKHK